MSDNNNTETSIQMDTLPKEAPTSDPTAQPSSDEKPPNGSNSPNDAHSTTGSGDDVRDGTEATDVKRLKLKLSGFIDLSGLISNVAVLVLLLGQQTHNVFFAPLLVFISVTVCLQIALALVLIIRNSFKEEENGASAAEQRNIRDRERNLLTASTILLMVISVFNVFIVAFAGVAQDSNTALTSSSETTSAS